MEHKDMLPHARIEATQIDTANADKKTIQYSLFII
jgi:hypothetical protein